jgi:hypothetical protein
MPEHNHIAGDFDSIMTSVGEGQLPSGVGEDNQSSGRANLYRRGTMPSAGSENPSSFSIMPPYYVLYFCKKL